MALEQLLQASTYRYLRKTPVGYSFIEFEISIQTVLVQQYSAKLITADLRARDSKRSAGLSEVSLTQLGDGVQKCTSKGI